MNTITEAESQTTNMSSKEQMQWQLFMAWTDELKFLSKKMSKYSNFKAKLSMNQYQLHICPGIMHQNNKKNNFVKREKIHKWDQFEQSSILTQLVWMLDLAIW